MEKGMLQIENKVTAGEQDWRPGLSPSINSGMGCARDKSKIAIVEAVFEGVSMGLCIISAVPFVRAILEKKNRDILRKKMRVTFWGISAFLSASFSASTPVTSRIKMQRILIPLGANFSRVKSDFRGGVDVLAMGFSHSQALTALPKFRALC
jgi:hypothetical protein